MEKIFFLQVEKMVQEFDDDGSGLIEFEEFLVLMAKKVRYCALLFFVFVLCLCLCLCSLFFVAYAHGQEGEILCFVFLCSYSLSLLFVPRPHAQEGEILCFVVL